MSSHLLPRLAVAGATALVAVGVGPAGRGQATPLACADPCTVTATYAGYLTPVTEIASGTTVDWSAIDTSHPTAEAAAPGDWCFFLVLGPFSDTDPVRFDVVDGGVLGTVAPGTPDAEQRSCTSAVEVAPGVHALTFACQLHPNMVGELLITE